ncbi:MAG: Mur ligase family protein [Oscillospiraceae bacterium]|nr:Mur ligase family protein [Oscillospiraceae bacterium]
MTELYNFFINKTILILGFGLEGKSTLKILEGSPSQGTIPCEIIIADKIPEVIADLPYKTYSGEDYLDAIYNDDVDIIMKSPGIPLLGEIPASIKEKITSQTDLLLRFRKNKIIGVTGTKGKSTTSSLIHHILKSCGKPVELIGNIGVPPLEFIISQGDYLPRVGGETDSAVTAVCEISCHQLEYVKASPDVAILLNIFEEHLDHYNSFEDYKKAKENIFRFQHGNDVLIQGDDEDLKKYRVLINPENAKLRGEHNYNNMAVAIKTAVIFGCDEKEAVCAAESFGGLPHRLEVFAEINGVEFVNDSISTIPEAVIAAIDAFPDTDTLIIGGMDRGINYNELIAFLPNCGIMNLIALPDSGWKIADLIPADSNLNIKYTKNMEKAVRYALKVTKKRCILSPAAASYGFYKNFEERGEHFKKLVKSINM